MKLFKAIAALFKTPSVPCSCGGRITEYLAWEDSYYACETCKKNISPGQFEILLQARRGVPAADPH